MHPWIAEQLNREHIAEMRSVASHRARSDRSRSLVGHLRIARARLGPGGREVG
jgi:hypothetical protein